MKLLMTAVCLLLLGLGVVFGMARRSNKTLVRLITLLLCVGAAFFIARVAVGDAAVRALEYAKANWITDPETLSYINDNPALVDALIALARMLIAPLIFWVSYLVLRVVSFFLYLLICLIFRVKGPRLFGVGRLAGAAIGLLCGLVGVLVLVVPVCGYSALAADVVDQLELKESEPVVVYTHTIATVGEAPIASTVYNLFGDKLFAGLTTAEFGEGKTVLQDELNAMLALLHHAATFVETPIEGYGEPQVNAALQMADDVGGSVMLSNVGSGVFATISNRWLAGDDFIGIARPDMGENADVIIDGVLEVLSTSNADNIDDDLRSVAEVFGLMVEQEIFPLLGSEDAAEALAEKIAKPEVLDALYAILDKNPRMEPLRRAFSELGIRILMDKLGLPEDVKESYGELLGDVATALIGSVGEDNTINVDALKGDVGAALETHGIAVDPAAVKLVAESLSQQFTGEELKAMTSDQVLDRLAEFLHAAGTPAA